MKLFSTACLSLVFTFLFLFNGRTNAQQRVHHDIQPDWVKDYPPFRIAGNLYYVGSYELACYLINTDKGVILINTGVAGSMPMIRHHIEQLGFNFRDIKILLVNQAHFDHLGAMAEIKKTTGAKFMADEKDARVAADGGMSDYAFGGKGLLFDPVRPDVLLHDHDTVKLGGTTIEVLHHPGHTKGSCSFLFDVKDNSHTYRVLIANMPTILNEAAIPSMATYPDIGKDYINTIKKMQGLKFDIWLAAHAGQFDLHKKHKPGDTYNPKAFIDPQGYLNALADMKKDYESRLKKG